MKWDKVRIDACSRIVSGATPVTSEPSYWDGDIAWATPKDLSDLEGPILHNTPRKITEAGLASCSAEILPAGSVLFSSRAPIGHVAINAIPMATNQGFKSFVPDPAYLEAGYLYHWLRANRDYLQSLGNGATFKEVSKEIVSRIEIPLPPLEEQRRIAAILDKADALRQKRRLALQKLDSLTQSIFLDMFGDPATNPKRWPITTLGEMLSSVSYGTSQKAGSVGNYPILRMNNITFDGRLDLRDLKFISFEGDPDRWLVKDGDILFNRTNSAELVGKTAVYRGQRPMAIAGYLIRFRTDKDSVPDYISSVLNSRYGKRTLRSMCKSIIGMANINATEVQTIKLPKPPLPLQEKFARWLAAVEGVRKAFMISESKAEVAFQSLQHRAFSGAL